VDPQLVCKRCGSPDVWWRQSKAGKWYLASVLGATYDYGRKAVNKPHDCAAYLRATRLPEEAA
jgi:hypothetical protein